MTEGQCCATCAEWVQEYDLPIGECDVRDEQQPLMVKRGRKWTTTVREALQTSAGFGHDCEQWRKGKGRVR